MIVNDLRFRFYKKASNKLVLGVFKTGKSNPEISHNINDWLIDPNFDCWDSKLQRFNEPTQSAINNNKFLEDCVTVYQKRLDEGWNIKNLFDEPINKDYLMILTLEDYLKQIIRVGKNAEDGLMPSANYQIYINLLHKLEEEDNILYTPIDDITDTHFKAFAKFMLTKKKGVNYKNVVRQFKTVINKARKAGLTSHVLNYDYIADAPREDQQTAIKSVIDKHKTITPKQYKAFLNMDLPLYIEGNYKHNEIYRDYCVLLYELGSRPCDIIKLNYDQFQEKNGKWFFAYLPTKKKNYKDKRKNVTLAPVTKNASAILDKYKGQNTYGHVLPLGINNHDWDFKDPESFRKWKVFWNSTMRAINAFCHKIGECMGVKGLTTYSFRHSALTHRANAKGANILQIAKEAGTSIKMLEDHYYDPTQVTDKDNKTECKLKVIRKTIPRKLFNDEKFMEEYTKDCFNLHLPGLEVEDIEAEEISPYEAK